MTSWDETVRTAVALRSTIAQYTEGESKEDKALPTPMLQQTAAICDYLETLYMHFKELECNKGVSPFILSDMKCALVALSVLITQKEGTLDVTASWMVTFERLQKCVKSFRENIFHKRDTRDELVFFSPTAMRFWLNQSMGQSVTLREFEAALLTHFKDEVNEGQQTFMTHSLEALRAVIRNKISGDGKTVDSIHLKKFLVEGTAAPTMMSCRDIHYPFRAVLKHVVSREDAQILDAMAEQLPEDYAAARAVIGQWEKKKAQGILTKDMVQTFWSQLQPLLEKVRKLSHLLPHRMEPLMADFYLCAYYWFFLARVRLDEGCDPSECTNPYEEKRLKADPKTESSFKTWAAEHAHVCKGEREAVLAYVQSRGLPSVLVVSEE
jgi:hypothetical protein